MPLSLINISFETLLQPSHLMVQSLAVRHITQLRQISLDRSVITSIALPLPYERWALHSRLPQTRKIFLTARYPCCRQFAFV